MVRSSNVISREIRPGSGQVAPVEPAPPKGPTDIGGLNLPEVGSQSLHSSDETGEQKTVERREVGRLMRDEEIGKESRNRKRTDPDHSGLRVYTGPRDAEHCSVGLPSGLDRTHVGDTPQWSERRQMAHAD